MIITLVHGCICERLKVDKLYILACVPVHTVHTEWADDADQINSANKGKEMHLVVVRLTVVIAARLLGVVGGRNFWREL